MYKTRKFYYKTTKLLHNLYTFECESGLKEGKVLQGRQSTRFQKCLAEPIVFPEVRVVSYFDWQIIKDHGCKVP